MSTVADEKPAYERRRFRTGDGEIVPRAYERMEARRLFWGALVEAEPRALYDLYEPAMIEACENHEDTEESSRRFDAWQRKYRLHDRWCLDSAATTVGMVAIPLARKGLDIESLPGPPPILIEGADLYEGKAPPTRLDDLHKLTFHPEHLLRTRTIYLDDLKYPSFEHDDGWYEEDEGDFGTYDPRAEKVDKAVERLMPELEKRLRRALECMKTEDTSGDTVPVRDLPPTHHFDWTVRYQVLGETYSHIARTAGTDHKNVSKSVKKVADIIGLTLREPDEGGRPAKRARCVKLTRKPGTS